MNKYYLAFDNDIAYETMKMCYPSAQVKMKFMLAGYRLVFRYCCGKALVTLEKYSDGEVPAVVWEICEEDSKQMDIQRIQKCGLEKVHFLIELGGIHAFTYLIINTKMGLPADEYLEHLFCGYEEHNFDLSPIEDALDRVVQDITETV